MPAPEPEARQALNDLARSLRSVHRALVDIVKSDYEKEWGPVSEGGQLLQLLTRHPQFDWLHQLSELMVDIDELLDDTSVDVTGDTMSAVFRQTRSLLSATEPVPSDFAKRYVALLQDHPHLVMAHANLQRLLTAHSS